MALVLPALALPPAGYARRPSPDTVFFVLLRDHPALAPLGLTVELAGAPSARTPPWVRSGVVRYLEAAAPGESTPISGVDVYAADPLAAQDAAATLATVWPYLKKVEIPSEGAYVSGAWVEVEPYLLAEPDETSTGDDLTRYHVELGLRLHPLPKD